MKITLLIISISVAIYYLIVGYAMFMQHKQQSKNVPPPSFANDKKIIGQIKPYKELLAVNDLDSDENMANETDNPTFVAVEGNYSESIELDDDDDDDGLYMATGVTFEEMQYALDVIKDEKEKDEKKEKEAGKILSRMLNTEMLESIVTQMPGYEHKIRSLIDEYISDDYEEFKIDDYL